MTAYNPPLLYITGASSGIGQALAARHAQAGYRLALVARRADAVQQWADAQGIAPALDEAALTLSPVPMAGSTRPSR